MRSLAWVLLVFFLTLGAQLVLWRLRRPARQYLVLSILALAVLVLSLAVFYALGSTASGAFGVLPETVLEYVNFAVLYVALMLAYMITYSAVQADSPTMVILLKLERAGPGAEA